MQPGSAILRISKTVTPGHNEHACDINGQALVDEDTPSLDGTIQDEDHVRFRYPIDVFVYSNLEPFG